MKIIKRILVILALILLGLVVGYLWFTGSQLTQIPEEIVNAFKGVIL